MKAVVLETRDEYCAVLKDDGTVEKIRMRANVGDEITMPAKAQVRHFPIKRVAAAAVAFITVCTGVLSQLQEYSVVSVDVDATVEYSLNRMDRVIRVKALNKEGEELARNIKKAGVEGSSFNKAVEKTAKVLEEDGYVEAGTNAGLLVSVSSKSDKKSNELAKKAQDALVSEESSGSVEKVSMEDLASARESGISAGRYAVTKDITGVESLDDAMIDIAKGKSASDLIEIAEEMEDAKEIEQQADENTEPSEVCEELVTAPIEAPDIEFDSVNGDTGEVVLPAPAEEEIVGDGVTPVGADGDSNTEAKSPDESAVEETNQETDAVPVPVVEGAE